MPIKSAKYKSTVQKIESSAKQFNMSKSELIFPSIQRWKTSQLKMKENVMSSTGDWENFTERQRRVSNFFRNTELQDFKVVKNLDITYHYYPLPTYKIPSSHSSPDTETLLSETAFCVISCLFYYWTV